VLADEVVDGLSADAELLGEIVDGSQVHVPEDTRQIRPQPLTSVHNCGILGRMRQEAGETSEN
jgi:hypothetical protein